MNPLDISTKIINDPEVSSAINSTETEKSNVRFEEVLSNQINHKKMEDPLKETDFPSKAEPKDELSLADSRNNAAEILIGIGVVPALACELSKISSLTEHSNGEMTFAIEGEKNAVEIGVKQIKDLKTARADLLKNMNENTSPAEKRDLFFSGFNSSSAERVARITNDKPIGSSASGLTHSLVEISTKTDTVLVNMTDTESPPPLLISPGTPPTAATPTLVQTSIPEHIHSDEWGANMVQQIKRFALEKIDLAVIAVTPKELGPIVVEIAFVQNETAIHFSAQHQETQDILSQHMNLLKESFSQAGMPLQSITTSSFSDDRSFSFSQQNPSEKKYTYVGKSDAKKIDPTEIEKLAVDTLNSSHLSVNSRVDLFA
jgi:flagellar hook-length control protein FliK